MTFELAKCIRPVRIESWAALKHDIYWMYIQHIDHVVNNQITSGHGSLTDPNQYRVLIGTINKFGNVYRHISGGLDNASYFEYDAATNPNETKWKIIPDGVFLDHALRLSPPVKVLQLSNNTNDLETVVQVPGVNTKFTTIQDFLNSQKSQNLLNQTFKHLDHIQTGKWPYKGNGPVTVYTSAATISPGTTIDVNNVPVKLKRQVYSWTPICVEMPVNNRRGNGVDIYPMYLDIRNPSEVYSINGLYPAICASKLPSKPETGIDIATSLLDLL